MLKFPISYRESRSLKKTIISMSCILSHNRSAVIPSRKYANGPTFYSYIVFKYCWEQIACALDVITFAVFKNVDLACNKLGPLRSLAVVWLQGTHLDPKRSSG